VNLQKEALKMELAQIWGRKLDEVEGGAKREVDKLDGMAQGLKQAADALNAHRAYYQKALDENEIDGPMCTQCMQVITRCVGGLQNLLDKTSLAKQLKHGEIRGLSRAIDVLREEYTVEKTRIEGIENMLEHDSRPDRAVADIQRRREEARTLGAAEPAADMQGGDMPKKMSKKKKRTKASTPKGKKKTKKGPAKAKKGPAKAKKKPDA